MDDITTYSFNFRFILSINKYFSVKNVIFLFVYVRFIYGMLIFPEICLYLHTDEVLQYGKF